MTIYLQNRDMIAAHNARFEKGEVSYSMKMNQFGDMLPEEFDHADLQTPRVLRGNSIVHDSRQLQSPIQCRLAQPGTRHRCLRSRTMRRLLVVLCHWCSGRTIFP